jgi:Zn-dependent M16 (insulinase) family peptidase
MLCCLCLWVQGSLNTFLNAFTYPDRTCYPVASCNQQVKPVVKA